MGEYSRRYSSTTATVAKCRTLTKLIYLLDLIIFNSYTVVPLRDCLQL